MFPLIPIVFLAILAGAAIGAVGSLAYTIPKHKDGQEPERLSSDDENS